MTRFCAQLLPRGWALFIWSSISAYRAPRRLGRRGCRRYPGSRVPGCGWAVHPARGTRKHLVDAVHLGCHLRQPLSQQPREMLGQRRVVAHLLVQRAARDLEGMHATAAITVAP